MATKREPKEREATTADEVVFLLHVVGSSLARHHETVAATAELSPQHLNALQFLDEPLSQKELAAHLRCEPPNITSIVDQLEARGLVQRTPDQADRRMKRVVTTRRGRALRARLKSEFRGYQPVHALEHTALDQLKALLTDVASRTDLAHRLDAL